MEEFFKENYLILTHSVEILAALVGLFFYKKYKHTAAKYFILFLCIIAICEFLATYTLYIKDDGFLSFLKDTIFEKNHWFTGLYWRFGAIIFYSLFFRKTISNTTYRFIIKVTIICFLLFMIIYIPLEYDNYFSRNLPMINVLGAIVVLISTALYFLEILSTNKILNFYKSIYFYIASVVVIWWLIITPLVFYDIYFSISDWNFIILKWQIHLFANILMYLTFTIAFFVSKPENE